jgi:hypothetical protein
VKILTDRFLHQQRDKKTQSNPLSCYLPSDPKNLEVKIESYEDGSLKRRYYQLIEETL